MTVIVPGSGRGAGAGAPPGGGEDLRVLVERVLFTEAAREASAGSAGRLAADACSVYRTRVREPERGITDADLVLLVTMGAASIEPWLQYILTLSLSAKKPRLHVDLAPTVLGVGDPVDDLAAAKSVLASVRSVRVLAGRRIRLYVVGSRAELAPRIVPRLRAILVGLMGGEPNPRRLARLRAAGKLPTP